MIAVCGLMVVIRCLLCVACCWLLLLACCSKFVVRFVVCSLLFWCGLFVVYCWVCVACCLLLVCCVVCVFSRCLMAGSNVLFVVGCLVLLSLLLCGVCVHCLL